jgi:hypothetical protein
MGLSRNRHHDLTGHVFQHATVPKYSRATPKMYQKKAKSNNNNNMDQNEEGATVPDIVRTGMDSELEVQVAAERFLGPGN